MLMQADSRMSIFFISNGEERVLGKMLSLPQNASIYLKMSQKLVGILGGHVFFKKKIKL